MNKSQMKVLDAIMAIRADGEPVKVRRISTQLGHKSAMWVWNCLHALLRMGFIDVETVNGRWVSGTIRPLVRFIPVEELCESSTKDC